MSTAHCCSCQAKQAGNSLIRKEQNSSPKQPTDPLHNWFQSSQNGYSVPQTALLTGLWVWKPAFLKCDLSFDLGCVKIYICSQSWHFCGSQTGKMFVFRGELWLPGEWQIWGSIPWLGHSKDSKNGNHCFAARYSVLRGWIRGLNHQMVP